MARIKQIESLTFRDMVEYVEMYYGLTEGLKQLPCPHELFFGSKKYKVPRTAEEFSKELCYGQRLYITRKEENDFDFILRIISGYYYPKVTGQKWDEDKVLLFGKNVLTCKVKELYPVAMRLLELTKELVDREESLLYREPSKLEKAAGIEKLNVFSELNSLDFLRDAMKCTVPEVLQTPYNECLVRFMNAKATADFQERYYELQREGSKPKSKFK